MRSKCKGYYDYITHRRFAQFKKRIEGNIHYSSVFHRSRCNHRLFKHYFGESKHMHRNCKYEFKETVKYKKFVNRIMKEMREGSVLFSFIS